MRAMIELENFREAEVSGLTDRLKITLQMLRYMVDAPIYITSGLRPHDTDSEHSLGQGVDISDNNLGEKISSSWRHSILEAAYSLGLRRIGVYDRHIHLGLAKSYPQDVSWWGISD